jgi:plastocyanin
VKLRRLVAMSTLAAALAVGATACGDGGDNDQGSAAPTGPVVVLKDSKFSPRDTTVTAGQPVTWEWKDRFTQHNVAAGDFVSRTQRSGTFSHTFAKPGSYPYRCTLHEKMTGTITVTAAQ